MEAALRTEPIHSAAVSSHFFLGLLYTVLSVLPFLVSAKGWVGGCVGGGRSVGQEISLLTRLQKTVVMCCPLFRRGYEGA